jgi:hypothetical protein
MKSVFAVFLALLIYPTLSLAWERPQNNSLPNTFCGIHLFQDVPSTALADSLAKFYATHIDIAIEIADSNALTKLVKYNPNFIHLMYRNSIGATKLWAPLPADSSIYCRNYDNNTFKFYGPCGKIGRAHV